MSGWSATAARPSSIAARASSISRCASSNSPRWIARIAFAHERIALRDAGVRARAPGRARRSAVGALRRRRPGPRDGGQMRAASTSAAGLTTMFTRSSPNAGRPLNDRRAVRPHGVSRVALPSRARTRGCGRRRSRAAGPGLGRRPCAFDRQQRPHVAAEQHEQDRGRVPHRPQRRDQTDQRGEHDALDQHHQHAATAFARASLRTRATAQERRPLAGRDDPPALRFGLRQHVHVSLEVLHALVRQVPGSPSTRGRGMRPIW